MKALFSPALLLIAACGNSTLPQNALSNTVTVPVLPTVPEAKGTATCPPDKAQPIVITGLNSKAVITQNPFRMAYFDGAGNKVLENVVNTRPMPFVPVNPPEPGGSSDAIPDQALYSPLTFEVGGETAAQFPGGPWQGNQMLGGGGGVQYSVTQVRSAQCGQGSDGRAEAVMTLETNDPTGRLILLKIQPDESGEAALQVKVTAQPATGIVALADSFDSGKDEEFFGFGGRHNAISQRGNSFPIWVEQENFSPGAAQGGADQTSNNKNYQFPNGATATYYPQALFYSSRPYGFLLENSELSRFKLAYTARPDAWQVAVAAGEMRFVVAAGSAAEKVKALTGINGRHRVPPSWALGPTLLRGVRVLSADQDTPATYAAKVNADLDRVLLEKLPITSYSVEGWDFMERPALQQVVSRIKGQGWRAMFYVRAYSSVDAANTENQKYFQEASTGGYCSKVGSPSGACYFFGSPFIVGTALLLDYTNTNTLKWWRDRIRLMLDLGADGFMQDFGESTMTDMAFANGENGLSMHNKYPTLYHAATRKVLDEYALENPARAAQTEGQFYFFNRAGYSGRRGSAFYENANFPGDNNTDYSHSNGLGSVITDMLSRSVGGAYGYNTDIGAYLDHTSGSPTKDLFIRWSQVAALSPFFRVHNSSTTGTRMPWSYDAETLKIWTDMAELHVRAKPYILKLWKEAQTTGLPMTRPLWLQFPDDCGTQPF
jgi:alpha-D-xyloside xylohydrolase